MGIEFTTLIIIGLDAYPSLLICHALPVSDSQTLIKPCFIKSRNNPNPKSELMHETKFSLKIFHATHVWLAEVDGHQTSKPVIVL